MNRELRLEVRVGNTHRETSAVDAFEVMGLDKLTT